MRRIVRKIPGAPSFLIREPQELIGVDNIMPSQATPPQLPSRPCRELVKAVVDNALSALALPKYVDTKLRENQRGGLRLNAVAWILGHVHNPRLTFDYCCWVLGSDTDAARLKLIETYAITEEEQVAAQSSWCWSVLVESERRMA